jgi:hypothetical protein
MDMKEELKIKDVMVGDYVDVRNDAAPNTPHLERFTPSHFLRDEHWFGIDLVPEILEKIGFVEKEFYSELIVGDYRIICDLHNVCIQHNNHVDLDIPIEYLHELQHAFKLCRISIKIGL